MTNLQVLTRSRKRPLAGDVFAMLLPDSKYLFGRVIATDATIGPIDDVILMYIFRERSEHKVLPMRSALQPDRLLVSPILTNRKGWSEGLFETIAHVPLRDHDILGQHCFRRWNGDYFDELSNALPGPAEPVGDFGLHSFRTIDDEISDALGLARSPG